MPAATVYIPTPWRRLTGGRAHVPVDLVEGATVAQLVDSIDANYPGLKAEIWADDDFKHYVNVYLNGEEVRALGGAATKVAAGDEVAFVPMLAGGAEKLVVPQAILDQMYRQALDEYPNECCGLLSGKDLTVGHIFPMKNVEASPFLYKMDPKEQLEVYQRLDDLGEVEVAAYHSHTHTEAYPSATDVKMAHPYLVYVIVTLKDRQNPVARAFKIEDGRIDELEVAPR